MNIILFIILLFFSFYFINKYSSTKHIQFINKLDKYFNEDIILKTTDINQLSKIKIIVSEMYNNEEYKYNFDIINNIINDIEKDISNKKSIKILLENEINMLDNLLKDLYEIRYRCKLKNNYNFSKNNINNNKILINKIKEWNN